MLYQRKQLADMSDIGGAGPLPAALDGLADASLANLSWADPALGYAGQGFFPVTARRLSRIEFLQRIPTAKRIAIRAAAVSDPILGDFLAMLDATVLVELDFADTVAGVGYLVSQGLITSDDATAILA